MSDQIVTGMVDTYRTGIEMLAQQQESKLTPYVRVESETGERVGFDQVGVVAAKEKTVRHGDTDYINTPQKKRWVLARTFDVADLLDQSDLLRILNNPGGEYGRAFIAALNRAQDGEIIAKAIGAAFTGKQGTTQVTLPAEQKIAAGGTGFTLAKVQDAMTKLKIGHAVEGDKPQLTIAWTANQEKEFMSTTEVKSIDYNTQRVLVSGGVDGLFYGFNYVRLEDWTDEVTNTLYRTIPKSGTVRSCVAWKKEGVLLNVPQMPNVMVDRLPGKRNSWQYYAWADFGATRMQESLVVQIDCEET